MGGVSGKRSRQDGVDSLFKSRKGFGFHVRQVASIQALYGMVAGQGLLQGWLVALCASRGEAGIRGAI